MKKVVILLIMSCISFKLFAQDQMSDLDYGMLLIKTSTEIEEIESNLRKISQDNQNKRINDLKALCQSKRGMMKLVSLTDNLLNTEKFREDPEMEQERLQLTKMSTRYKTTIENVDILYKGKLNEICKKLNY